MVSVVKKPGAWVLLLECDHTAVRSIQLRVDRTALAAPAHIYCVECLLRRPLPFEHEERLADFDARLAAKKPHRGDLEVVVLVTPVTPRAELPAHEEQEEEQHE